jgi:hypothetical protein
MTEPIRMFDAPPVPLKPADVEIFDPPTAPERQSPAKEIPEQVSGRNEQVFLPQGLCVILPSTIRS